MAADTRLHDAMAEAHDVSWARDRLTLSPVGRSAATSALTTALTAVAVVWPLLHAIGAGTSILAGTHLLTVAGCLLAYAVAASVEFEVGPGFAVPTTPVLAAALFLLHPALVPLLVLAGLATAAGAKRLVDRDRRDTITALAVSSCHAVGPALVFALGTRWLVEPAAAGSSTPGAPPVSLAAIALYGAALAAQVLFDVTAAWIHNCWDLGVPTARLLESFRFTVVVDALLAPLGLVAVAAAGGRWWSPLLLLPTVGLLWLMQRDRRRYVDRSVALANAYRDTAAEARTDSLTGLGNRMAWDELLDGLGRSGAPCGFVVLDIDGLKAANDRYGHDVGDRLIAAVGQLVAATLPPGASAARLGGDEFGVALPGALAGPLSGPLSDVSQAATPAVQAEALATRLARAIAAAEPLSVVPAGAAVPGSAPVPDRVAVAASIGWSATDPGDGEPPEALAAALARADHAVNADKIVRGARRL